VNNCASDYIRRGNDVATGRKEQGKEDMERRRIKEIKSYLCGLHTFIKRNTLQKRNSPDDSGSGRFMDSHQLLISYNYFID
jgi:hypothetical protein